MEDAKDNLRIFLSHIGVKYIELELQGGAASFLSNRGVTDGNGDCVSGAPIGRFVMDKNGTIVEANYGAAGLLEIEHNKLLGSNFRQFLTKESLSTFHSFVIDMGDSKSIQTTDVIAVKGSGKILHAHLSGSILVNRNGNYLINLIDTSTLEHNFNVLNLYRNMLQNISEGIFLIRTSDDVIVFVNPALERMFGYKNHEMVGQKISIMNAPTNKSPEEVARKISKVLNKVGHWKGTIKNIRKDGSIFWCYAHVTTFDDPEFGQVWVSVHTDITERKKAQEELLQSKKNLQLEVKKRTLSLDKVNEKLKLELLRRKNSQEQLNFTLQQYKNLFNYLQKVREEEQVHIARVIHDDISQMLNTLKIELSLLYEKAKSKSCEDIDSIEQMLQLTDGCIGSITSVITELRPILLDKEGLIPALRKIFSNFQKHTGIVCVVLVKEETPCVIDAISTTIYRVVQEVITNIRNHSKATRVNVTIASTASSFTITIQDNGIGITPEDISRPNSFGIIGMKERIGSVKGTLTMNGVPDKGTTVKIRIPLNH